MLFHFCTLFLYSCFWYLCVVCDFIFLSALLYVTKALTWTIKDTALCVSLLNNIDILSMNFVLPATWFEKHGLFENIGFTDVFRLHPSKTLVKPMLSMNFVLAATWFENHGFFGNRRFYQCFSAPSFNNIGKPNVFHEFHDLRLSPSHHFSRRHQKTNSKTAKSRESTNTSI